MHGEFIGHILFDQVEEATELAGTVPRCHVGDRMAGGDPASGAGQAIAHVVDELRDRREPELLDRVRLEPKGAPDPRACKLRHAQL